MSQTKEILNYLNSGKRLTSLEALEKFNCLRLAARIKDLRNMGYKVETNMLQFKKKRAAQYYIIK